MLDLGHMEDIQTTIKKSLDFFKKQALDPQIAYPVSSLPYPLEVMRKALQFHVASLNKPDATREDLQQMRMARSFYITLGDLT